MDAFDEGIVTTTNFAQARRIIMARARVGKEKKKTPEQYTVDQLKQDIAEATKAKVSYVREAKSKESRFLTLLTGSTRSGRTPSCVDLLREEKLPTRPELAGDFAYESSSTSKEPTP